MTIGTVGIQSTKKEETRAWNSVVDEEKGGKGRRDQGTSLNLLPASSGGESGNDAEMR